MEVTAKFENRTGNSDKGKLVLSLVNDAAEYANVNLYFTITSPAGVIYNTIGGTALALATDASGTVKVNIPVDVNTALITGDYTILVRVVNQANPAQITDIEETWEFCTEEKGAVRFSGNCGGPLLQLFDQSNYTGYSILSRTLTLAHPELEGIDTPPNESTTGASIAVQPQYSGSTVIYTGTLTAAVKKTYAGASFTWEYCETWTGSGTYTFLCYYDLSGLANCYEREINRLQLKSKQVGGMKALTKSELDLMIALMSNWTLFHTAQSCGDTAKMEIYYTELKQLLNCNCCSADEISPIQTLTPILPASADTLWVDVPEDALTNNWEPYPDSTSYLQYKIQGGALYVRGQVINNTLASGVHLLAAFLDSSFLTQQGIYLAQNWFQDIVLYRDATTTPVHVGHAFFGSNAWSFQTTAAYVAGEPVRISFVIPLDGQQGQGIS